MVAPFAGIRTSGGAQLYFILSLITNLNSGKLALKLRNSNATAVRYTFKFKRGLVVIRDFE